jgi:hypothetical protein
MTTDFALSAEEFLQLMGREFYENGAGLKDSLNIIPIYEKYGWIFERPAVDEALKRKDTEGKYIATFLAEGYLDASTKELSEKITNAMTQAKVEWQGEEIPFRRVSILIANEPDSNKRHELEARARAKNEEQNPNRIERLQKMHAMSKELGFANYRDLNDELKGIHLDWLLQQMKELLYVTEGIYESELQYFLDSIGVKREEATPADLAYLFRAPQFDSLFPAGKLVPSLKMTLGGMGLHLDEQPNIHLDTESRPLKSPRAFCSPVIVPDEVYLVISPSGGQDDYKAILHESGHSEHLGNISPELPFAYKRLGDGSISEAYAFLMDNLLKNHNWFVEILGEKNADDYLRLARFHKLWILRRYSAKLHYESRLHASADIQSMAADYAETLGNAIKVKISPANFLSDCDDGLYASCYLRAWIFEVMLRKHLEDSFGVLWFRTPQAGETLLKMWRQGQQYSVDELARGLCYERLDAGPLIRELSR